MIFHTHRQTLLDLARTSISFGTKNRSRLSIDLNTFHPDIKQIGACFVTLTKQGALRGCIGSLQAHQPLVENLVNNAYSSALCDPRFPPVTEQEMNELTIHISVLSPAEPLLFQSEKELLTLIQPGKDGLILQQENHRGTFLPSVWETFPEPQLFLNQLKQKTGLPASYWSNTIKVFRYTTDVVEE